MFASRTRVLIILPQEIVDRARAFAGRATASMKLPVSLQIVFRALIDEGLRRPGDQALLANVARQAEAVRRIRSVARKRSTRSGTEAHRGARPRPASNSRRST